MSVPYGHSRKQEKMMKKQQIPLVFLLLLACLLISTSCDQSLSSFGVLKITIGEPAQPKSLNEEPDGVDLSIQTYTITLTKGEETITIGPLSKEAGASVVIDALSAGNWTLRVAGKNSGGTTIAEIEGGSLSIAVQRGRASEVVAKIVPSSGSGTLSLSMMINGAYDQLTEPKIAVTFTDADGTEQQSQSYAIPASGLENQQIHLPARWYQASVQLIDGEAVLSTQLFFPRIVAGATTTRTVTFEIP